MNEEMTALLEHAKSKYKNLDCLIDIYSFETLWGSKRFVQGLEYSQEEFSSMNVRDFINVESDEVIRMALLKLSGRSVDRRLKTKSGKIVLATGKEHTFMFDKEPYIAITDIVFERDKKK